MPEATSVLWPWFTMMNASWPINQHISCIHVVRAASSTIIYYMFAWDKKYCSRVPVGAILELPIPLFPWQFQQYQLMVNSPLYCGGCCIDKFSYLFQVGRIESYLNHPSVNWLITLDITYLWAYQCPIFVIYISKPLPQGLETFKLY